MKFVTGRVSVRSLIAILAVALAASPAAAQVRRPFQGRVVATWDNVFNGLFAPPANFVGISQVTHMGLSAQSGTLTLQAPIGPGIFPGTGSVTITAANGEQLSFNYVGLLDASSGVGVGTFQFTGGTGRFTNAVGGGRFHALIDVSQPVNQPMTVALDGLINY